MACAASSSCARSSHSSSSDSCPATTALPRCYCNDVNQLPLPINQMAAHHAIGSIREWRLVDDGVVLLGFNLLRLAPRRVAHDSDCRDCRGHDRTDLVRPVSLRRYDGHRAHQQIRQQHRPGRACPEGMGVAILSAMVWRRFRDNRNGERRVNAE